MSKKISELTKLSTVSGAEIIPSAKDNLNYGIRLDKIKEYTQDITSEPIDNTVDTIVPNILNEVLTKTPLTLTDAEKLQVKDNLEISKMDLFIDMFNEAAGDDGYARIVDGVFDCMLNGVTGITYEEAIRIFIASAHMTHNIRQDLAGVFSQSSGFRTYFPIKSHYLSGQSKCRCAFQGNRDVEVIAFAPHLECSATTFDCYSTFRNCPNLRKIIGSIRHFTDNEAFYASPNLEEVSLMYLNANVDFRYNPKLSLASFKYLVAEKSSNTAITITVHPDVYAKLTDENNTEWHALIAQAAEKNITFITTE